MQKRDALRLEPGTEIIFGPNWNEQCKGLVLFVSDSHIQVLTSSGPAWVPHQQVLYAEHATMRGSR
jgi:hypothetical protein